MTTPNNSPEYAEKCRLHRARIDTHIADKRSRETPEQTAVLDLIDPLRSNPRPEIRCSAIQHHMKLGNLTKEMLKAAEESA